MAALVWLLIPVAGVMVSGVWSAWVTRRRSGVGGGSDTAGVRRYEAFRAAMERPVRRAAPEADPAPADG